MRERTQRRELANIRRKVEWKALKALFPQLTQVQLVQHIQTVAAQQKAEDFTKDPTQWPM